MCSCATAGLLPSRGDLQHPLSRSISNPALPSTISSCTSGRSALGLSCTQPASALHTSRVISELLTECAACIGDAPITAPHATSTSRQTRERHALGAAERHHARAAASLVPGPQDTAVTLDHDFRSTSVNASFVLCSSVGVESVIDLTEHRPKNQGHTNQLSLATTSVDCLVQIRLRGLCRRLPALESLAGETL